MKFKKKLQRLEMNRRDIWIRSLWVTDWATREHIKY